MRKLPLRSQILYQLIFLLAGLFVLIPVWALGQMAFDGSIRGWPLEFRILPKEPTLQVFAGVWRRPAQELSFLAALRNSMVVSGGAALFSVVFGASMAYAFARYRFPGRRTGLFALLVGALLPPVALMTPLFILLSAIGIRTTLWGLIIVYTAFSMPFCIWNMRAGFQSVSKELEESAFLDGATPLQAFLWITLPLAVPSIVVAALVAFLAGYSEFALAWLFVDSSKNVTLAMAISGMVGTTNASWNSLAALAIMMSVPVILIFYLLQRYLLDRLLVGNIGES
jgi:arabinogalactan oligomer / maltooligosaccharide transport system permease protein